MSQLRQPRKQQQPLFASHPSTHLTTYQPNASSIFPTRHSRRFLGVHPHPAHGCTATLYIPSEPFLSALLSSCLFCPVPNHDDDTRSHVPRLLPSTDTIPHHTTLHYTTLHYMHVYMRTSQGKNTLIAIKGWREAESGTLKSAFLLLAPPGATRGLSYAARLSHTILGRRLRLWRRLLWEFTGLIYWVDVG